MSNPYQPPLVASQSIAPTVKPERLPSRQIVFGTAPLFLSAALYLYCVFSAYIVFMYGDQGPLTLDLQIAIVLLIFAIASGFGAVGAGILVRKWTVSLGGVGLIVGGIGSYALLVFFNI